MRDSYSLLQEEDNYTKNLYLKHLDQNEAYYQMMVDSIDLIADKIECLDTYLSQIGIEIRESYNDHFDHVHAQYRSDENEHYIWLNLLWIERYSKYMSETQARDLHIAHELFHHIETTEKMWYHKLKRRLRNRYSEVSAIYFSQVISKLKNHPYLYEYQSKIDNNELKIEGVIKYLKEG